ncbi:MAG TPA: hypothetical protein VGK45_11115 [Thermoanaerobaculia bacterium]
MVQKYVLDTISGDGLRVYVVWGPMLGEEKESDVKPATMHLPDARVTHFWTASHTLAVAMAQPVGLKDEKAWDTFQLFAADAHWGETPPVPAYFMHVGKSLPPDRRFNGETLAQKVRELLAAH